MKVVLKRHVLAGVGCFVAIMLVGCTRTVHVAKQMTWECAPEEYNPALGGRPDDYVRFRYVEEPHCFDIESAQSLCAELREIAKPVVTVDFEVWGGPGLLARRGYRIAAVEGHPLIDVGGGGGNGSNDFEGECPISKVISRLGGHAKFVN